MIGKLWRAHRLAAGLRVRRHGHRRGDRGDSASSALGSIDREGSSRCWPSPRASIWRPCASRLAATPVRSPRPNRRRTTRCWRRGRCERRNLELREQSLRRRRERVGSERRKLVEEKKRLQKLREAFQSDLAALESGALGGGREDARRTLEAIKPKQAKELLMQMLERNELDEVAILLERHDGEQAGEDFRRVQGARRSGLAWRSASPHPPGRARRPAWRKPLNKRSDNSMLPLALDNLSPLPPQDSPTSSVAPSTTPFEDYLRSARSPAASNSAPADQGAAKARPTDKTRTTPATSPPLRRTFSPKPTCRPTRADPRRKDRTPSGSQRDQAAAGNGQTTSTNEKGDGKDDAAPTVELSAAAAAAQASALPAPTANAKLGICRGRANRGARPVRQCGAGLGEEYAAALPDKRAVGRPSRFRRGRLLYFRHNSSSARGLPQRRPPRRFPPTRLRRPKHIRPTTQRKSPASRNKRRRSCS